MENTGFKNEFRIFCLHKTFLYEKIKITPVLMAPLLSLWC